MTLVESVLKELTDRKKWEGSKIEGKEEGSKIEGKEEGSKIDYKKSFKVEIRVEDGEMEAARLFMFLVNESGSRAGFAKYYDKRPLYESETRWSDVYDAGGSGVPDEYAGEKGLPNKIFEEDPNLKTKDHLEFIAEPERPPYEDPVYNSLYKSIWGMAIWAEKLKERLLIEELMEEGKINYDSLNLEDTFKVKIVKDGNGRLLYMHLVTKDGDRYSFAKAGRSSWCRIIDTETPQELECEEASNEVFKKLFPSRKIEIKNPSEFIQKPTKNVPYIGLYNVIRGAMSTQRTQGKKKNLELCGCDK